MVYTLRTPMGQRPRAAFAEVHMHKTAKLFKNGRSQAVRLPAAFRFSSDEVYVRKDPQTGDVILSAKPSWDELFAFADSAEIPSNFLRHRDRRPPKKRQLL
jgi:antitoxin VapB